MVQCLRNHVADRMRDLQDFELLDTLVSYMWQDNWRDGWNPAELLRRCGFEALQHATTVLAVQIHANATDLTVKFEAGPEQQTPFIANGAVNLELLREEFGDQFRQCGDWHWGTQQDIIMLSEFLNIGFWSSRVKSKATTNGFHTLATHGAILITGCCYIGLTPGIIACCK